MDNNKPSTPEPAPTPSWGSQNARYLIEYALVWILVAALAAIIIGPLGLGQTALNVLLAILAGF